MGTEQSLGIQKLLGVHYYVRDLERSRRFYVEALDFMEIGASSKELETAGKQRSLVFAGGDCMITCSTPIGEGGRAYRYLKKHPDGIGTVAFLVTDAQRCFEELDRRGATPIDEPKTYTDAHGTLKTFSITTPFGDTTFRFIEQGGYRGFFPGMDWYESPKGGKNQFNFVGVDHVTSNFQTMKPTLLWLSHVLGFKPLWDVEFHTQEVATAKMIDGSGLRSAVYWDPTSQTKFANNEPYRPNFKQSQINLFNEDHRGDGVQHIALSTTDIIATVRGLLGRGVRFMKTPSTYYDALPARLEKLGFRGLDEDIQVLKELGILVDGDAEHGYLLQIFLQDSAGLYEADDAGPFFFEIIERKGDEGFGAGNFRALFESIEREQRQMETTD